MTFEEWWDDCMGWTEYEPDPREKALAQAAWEAGMREGIDRMYTLYDICPQCRLPNGQHKMDCGKWR